jgi:BMFP domain-containing protein YqiC
MPYYRTLPFAPQTSRQEEFDYLKNLAQSMRANLEDLETRIKELESK